MSSVNDDIEKSATGEQEVSTPAKSVNASTLSTEFIYWLVRVIVETFFREISVRGSFHVPKTGPTLVVIAPHANQFLDAAISMHAIYLASGRITHFIEAAVSLRRRVIGVLSRMAGSIPVERAQDLLTPREGLIKYKNYPDDELTIIGQGTHFTKDCGVKSLIGLPHSAGNVKVGEVLSDTELKLSSPMRKEAGIRALQQYTPYKCAPRIDNHKLFDTVFDCLHEGNLIAIASEGGSHDRTELLPLKPGVAIMALGAVAKYPGMEVKIVPCGMNYFHAHKFRSRAVLDFGIPIVIDNEWAEKYKEDSRKTVSDLMDIITSAMKAVTVQSPDYETLQVIQAARRLYSYGGHSSNLPLPVVVELNRNLLIGYSKYKDDPKIRHLTQSVIQYNQKLKYYGLRDHQIASASEDYLHNGILLIKRLLILAYYGILCLPGTVLFSPVFYACAKISAKKQREALAKSAVKIKANDVLGSWKVLIAMVVSPILYALYSILGTYLLNKYDLGVKLTGTWFDSFVEFVTCWIVLVCTTYSAFRMGEVGVDVAKSIWPLILSLFPKTTELRKLKEERAKLSMEITEVINELGPKVFPQFNKETLKELSDEVIEENKTINQRDRHYHHHHHHHHHRRRHLLNRLKLEKISTSGIQAQEENVSQQKEVPSSGESFASSESTLARERTSSVSSSVYSGFSEFENDEDTRGKMPNLSHVSIFPDTLQMSDRSSVYSESSADIESIDSHDGEYTTGAGESAADLTNRVRKAVIERNKETADSDREED